jgi:hypothetical protein
VQGLAGIVYDGFVAPPPDSQNWAAMLERESSREIGITLQLTFSAEPF